jgi:hypothetical protein
LIIPLTFVLVISQQMLTNCLQIWESSVGVVTTLRTKSQEKIGCISGRGKAWYTAFEM